MGDSFYGGSVPKFSEQYTIPYSSKIKVLTGSDFTVDSREKIYLRDDKENTRYVILFYKEEETDSQKLRAIQNVFIKSASISAIEGISFKVCNLSVDSTLKAAFKYVMDTPAHPFNWIHNAADTNIFILIYYSGYPQMFYEGPLETSAFTEFTLYLSTPTKAENLFEKYNSGNGFINRDARKTYIDQAWGKYSPSGGLSVADALIKPENIPVGVRAIAKGEYIGNPPGIEGNPDQTFPSRNTGIKESKIKLWTDNINQIYKSDNNRIREMLSDKLVANNKDSNKISEEFGNSNYIDYLIVYGKNPDNKLKSIIRDVYDISKKLYMLKDAYGLKTEDIAKLAVNMYGFYKFKEKDPSVKIENSEELEALYISQNIVSKLVNVNPVFISQISKNVAAEILNVTGSINTAKKLLEKFNTKNNKEAGKKDLDLDEMKTLIVYFKDKIEDLKNTEDYKDITDERDKKNYIKNPDNYDISSDESFPFRNTEINNKTNQNLEKLINNDDDVKRTIIFAILNESQSQKQGDNKQKSNEGGGDKFGGGGNRGGRKGRSKYDD